MTEQALSFLEHWKPFQFPITVYCRSNASRPHFSDEGNFVWVLNTLNIPLSLRDARRFNERMQKTAGSRDTRQLERGNKSCSQMHRYWKWGSKCNDVVQSRRSSLAKLHPTHTGLTGVQLLHLIFLCVSRDPLSAGMILGGAAHFRASDCFGVDS